MALVETAAAYLGIVGSGSLLLDYLHNSVQLEDILTRLVRRAFEQELPRLRPLCPGNEPYFRDHDFKTSLSGKDLTAPDPDKLPDALLPLLIEAIDVPGAESLSDFDGIFNTIVRLAVTDFWREVADYQIPSNQLLLQYLRKVDQTLTESQRGQDELRESLEKLVSFARSIDQGLYNKLADRAPPKLHTIDDRSYSNPFIEARAEDFNHNYEKLARLFQGSPEWESIQSRTDNVFIEGGRGTGKIHAFCGA